MAGLFALFLALWICPPATARIIDETDFSGSETVISFTGLTETDFSLVRFEGDEERAAAHYAGTTPLTPDDVADAVFYCANTPEHVDILNLVMMPTTQRYPGYMDRD